MDRSNKKLTLTESEVAEYEKNGYLIKKKFIFAKRNGSTFSSL